jgi:hypothetical protein
MSNTSLQNCITVGLYISCNRHSMSALCVPNTYSNPFYNHTQNTKATAVFEVPTAVLAENQVLHGTMLGKAHSSRRSKGPQCLHIQGQIVSVDCLTLKKTLWSFEMLEPLHANSSITSQKPLLLHKSPFHTDKKLTADSWTAGFYCAFKRPLLYTDLFTTVSRHLLRTLF